MAVVRFERKPLDADGNRCIRFRDRESLYRCSRNWSSWRTASGIIGRLPYMHSYTHIGVSGLTIHYDWMHCKSLGIDKTLIGSTFYYLVHFLMPSSVEANIARLWMDIEEAYEQTGSRNRQYGSRHSPAPVFRMVSAEVVMLLMIGRPYRYIFPNMFGIWHRVYIHNISTTEISLQAIEKSIYRFHI